MMDDAKRSMKTVTELQRNTPHEVGREAASDYSRGTVIEPSKVWRVLDLRELWSYRELLGVLVMRDVKVRYKQTVLGAAWVVLRPLLTVAIFTVIFGMLVRIPSDGYPYAVFVYAALLPWTFFAGAVAASGNSLVGSAGLIGKVYFPRLIVPFASVGAGLVDFAVSAAFLLVLMPLLGAGWSLSLLAVPLLLLPILLLALGVGTLFSALTVAYRDFVGVMGFMLQIWMYATPVIYPSSLVPERWRWVLHLNPMSGLVEGFRSAFLGRPFDIVPIAVSSAVAAAAFMIGIAYFAKVERRFADII
jgi:lipopolysaccharide transport system permease protein